MLLAPAPAWPLGCDHGRDLTSTAADKWPAGLVKALDTECRIHGFCVNTNDHFFFRGDTDRLNTFLALLQAIDENESERGIVFHDGAGRARSPWDKGEGKPCDWSLDVEYAFRDGKGEVVFQKIPRLTVHVWLAGVKRDAVWIPPSFTTPDEKKK